MELRAGINTRMHHACQRWLQCVWRLILMHQILLPLLLQFDRLTATLTSRSDSSLYKPGSCANNDSCMLALGSLHTWQLQGAAHTALGRTEPRN